MSITIYGIKNCDTMKKAFAWLQDNGVEHTFHDYKKNGADETVLRAIIAEHGWEQVLNRRGLTWRKLPDEVKKNMDTQSAIKIALDNPSIIKRPLLAVNGQYYLGFDAKDYADILSA